MLYATSESEIQVNRVSSRSILRAGSNPVGFFIGDNMKYDRSQHKHEDNLKAELSKRAQSSGLFLHVEYVYKNCRFDCVLVRKDEVLAIIEVKNWTEKQAKANKKNPSKQLVKYSQFQLPVYVIWDFEGTTQLMKALRRRARKFDEQGKITDIGVKFFPDVKIFTDLDRLACQQKRDMGCQSAGKYYRQHQN